MCVRVAWNRHSYFANGNGADAVAATRQCWFFQSGGKSCANGSYWYKSAHCEVWHKIVYLSVCEIGKRATHTQVGFVQKHREIEKEDCIEAMGISIEKDREKYTQTLTYSLWEKRAERMSEQQQQEQRQQQQRASASARRQKEKNNLSIYTLLDNVIFTIINIIIQKCSLKL